MSAAEKLRIIYDNLIAGDEANIPVYDYDELSPEAIHALIEAEIDEIIIYGHYPDAQDEAILDLLEIGYSINHLAATVLSQFEDRSHDDLMQATRHLQAAVGYLAYARDSFDLDYPGTPDAIKVLEGESVGLLSDVVSAMDNQHPDYRHDMWGRLRLREGQSSSSPPAPAA